MRSDATRIATKPFLNFSQKQHDDDEPDNEMMTRRRRTFSISLWTSADSITYINTTEETREIEYLGEIISLFLFSVLDTVLLGRYGRRRAENHRRSSISC